MNSVILIYDNTDTPNSSIKGIVGNTTFADIILRRNRIKNKFYEFVKSLAFDVEIYEINHKKELDDVFEKLMRHDKANCVLHVFSQNLIQCKEKAQLLFTKAQYIKNNLAVIQGNELMMFMVSSIVSYNAFISQHIESINKLDISLLSSEFDAVTVDDGIFLNISIYRNFMKYITGGFDARFFNFLDSDEHIVNKHSLNAIKLKAEYDYYHMLPDAMKIWYVMPFNYEQTESGASYMMERYHMPDLAVRWVHGSIDTEEFNQIMQKIFHYLNTRIKRPVSVTEYREASDALYLGKLDARIEQLKQTAFYPQLAAFISNGTMFSSIDDIVFMYKLLYNKLIGSCKFRAEHVISHGDLCFSNILFNKEVNLLRLIDPKGASSPEQLYIDPYYDVAKLSHSICGLYDIFNSCLNRIYLNTDMRFELDIDFDNSVYVDIFKGFCNAYNFDFLIVRLYEASLFLSMLPLHMDNPQKVFGFLINAINILKEVEGSCEK